MDQTLVSPRHRNLLYLVSLVLVIGQQKLQIIQTRDAVDWAESRKDQNHIILTIRLFQPQNLDRSDVISDWDLHLKDIRLDKLTTREFYSIQANYSVLTAENNISRFVLASSRVKCQCFDRYGLEVFQETNFGLLKT